MFLSSKLPLVAIDIGSHSIKLAQLRLSRDRYELVSFGIMPLEPETIVDGSIKDIDRVTDTLSSLVKAEGVKSRHAIASVSGEAVIIKKIKMPAMSREELSEKIQEEAEEYIPFDIDDVTMDFQILRQPGQISGSMDDPESKDKMEVLLVAVQREIIEARMEILEGAGLKPVIMDLDVFAMMNAVNMAENLEHRGCVVLIDLGSSFTNINIVNNGFTHFTRDFRFGGLQCTGKLQAEFKISPQEADEFKRGNIPDSVDEEKVKKIILESFDPIIEEVKNSISGFENLENCSVDQAFLTGGGALLNGVDRLFADKLGIATEIFNPFQNIKVDLKKFDAKSVAELAPLTTVALGLAARKFDYT
jgi:type IV pilus assembly protein PilM